MPRIVDHAERRTEIVYALWAVIHEKGLDSVSFRAVAEAAGVSIGRIQHYFASKEELIREGCAQMVTAAQDQYAEAPEDAAPQLSLWHLVAAPIPATQARRIGAAVWYAYLAKSVSDPALRKIIADAVEIARTEAVGLLRAARQETGGAADRSDPRTEREALGLLALGDGLTQRVMVGALTSENAEAVLAEEFERRGLGPQRTGQWRR